MDFLDDYKDLDGRIAVGSNASFICKTYGFSPTEDLDFL